ncbi:MAG: serine/threonine protein kinase [Polyangiaceae bacterium]|nr:serine/threonine protein kinase [Polyangiaceae bacterium]
MHTGALPPAPQPITVGRYTLFDALARGGMATVHIGRLAGVGGFARTVAVKRLHPQLANDPDFVAMLLDEARMVTRIRHPHVVQTLDVVSMSGELLLVMDYVEGESLSRLLKATTAAKSTIPSSIATAIVIGVLEGLDAAHDAKSDSGQPLGIVHRDVSPQNVLVGVDGVSRLIDFGVAKAVGRSRDTDSGQVKGKLAYMAPEQIKGEEVDRRTDVFAASIVLWEALTARRLFSGKNEGETIFQVLDKKLEPPSTFVSGITKELDAVVMRGLSRDPTARFPSAIEMAHALETATLSASKREVAAWVRAVAAEGLEARARVVARVEQTARLDMQRTEPNLPPLPPMEPSPASLPTRVELTSSPAASVPTELGTLTQASNITLPGRAKDPTRALWVLVGVIAFGGLVGGLAFLRSRAETAEGDDLRHTATALAAATTPAAAPAPEPSAAPSAAAPAPASASAEAAPAPVPASGRSVAPKPAKPSDNRPAAPTARPRETLYGRE